MTKEYWLHKSSREAISHLTEAREKWSTWNNSPIRQAWIRNYLAYYSPAIAPTSWDSSMIFEGVQGELVRFYTPKARSLIRKQITLITKQKLAAQAMAQTQGSDVIQDLKLGNSLIDQLIQSERLDVKGKELCEGGLVVGAWFTETEWRTDKGKPYTRAENGSVIYTGGVDIDLRSVFDVFYDVTISSWDRQEVVETRKPMNRWNLIAQHPELEDKILALPTVSETRGPNSWFDRIKGEEDLVYVYKMYAKPMPSLPVGRMIIYGSDECVFYDDENIYEGIPVEPFLPEKVLGVCFGYPQLTNLLACQEMFDNSLSAIATNQAQFAVHNVAVPRGSNINVQELNGMRFVSFTPQNVPGGGKPEVLNLNQPSSETFKFAEVLGGEMADMSGIPATLSGAPPPGVTSGTAIATLSTNAIEFFDSVSMAYFSCWEKTLEHAVNCYKKFAKLDQSVSMKGRNNQIMTRTFKGEQLQCISGIKIQIANPLMQTIAGRLEIGEKLLQMPREIWPQYVSILEGRPLSEIYKGDLSQQDLVYTENEMLMGGTAVPALASDDHGLHAKEHAGLLNDPTVRINGPTIAVIFSHIEEHRRLAQQTDPYFMAMVRTGKIPDPMMALPGGEPPQEGSSSPAGMPTKEKAQPAQDALDRRGA
jgi:hypothetical protein